MSGHDRSISLPTGATTNVFGEHLQSQADKRGRGSIDDFFRPSSYFTESHCRLPLDDLVRAGWKVTIDFSGERFTAEAKRWNTERGWRDVPDELQMVAGNTVSEAIETLCREIE